MSKQNKKIQSPVVSRQIGGFDRVNLFVRAGGRCEFDGCNEFLLEHHVTLTEGNFAQFAHIVAFSEAGPRGRDNRPSNINSITNLMLLCPKCHKLIDDNPTRFSRATLEGYKTAHEKRIHHVTGLGPEQKTSILVVTSKIGDQTVTIPFDHILEAITPRYPYSKDIKCIDLTQLSTNSDGFIKAACDSIQESVKDFIASSDVKRSGHISLFGLAPIPVLMFLGSQLSNKVPLDLYQRHRDTENWTWKSFGNPVKYAFRRLREGTSVDKAILLISLSGKIPLRDLPSNLGRELSVYELTIDGSVPTPTFLRQGKDLDGFRTAYQTALRSLQRDIPNLKEIHVFPAVPAPIAVLCGRELLPKIDPAVAIYDKDKRKNGFTYQLTINQ